MSYILDAAANCTLTFSVLLGALFVIGMFVIADRLFFFVRYGWQLLSPDKELLSGSFAGATAVVNGPDGSERRVSHSVFRAFAEKALEFRLTSRELVYTLEIISHAQEEAVRQKLGGQMLNWGQSTLQLLGVTAPTVGFVGTLVGLIQSFRELGSGGEINNVISGLGLSMTTSLVGAIISVLFLTVAWMLGAAQLRFQRQLDQIIASKQAGYQSVI